MGDTNCENVYFLSYNAIISGSIELRALNKNYLFPELKAMDGRHLTRIGKYALMYDNPAGGGGKHDEPNYDGITSCIALLNDGEFNRNFTYRKVKLCKTDGDWGNSHFMGAHSDTVKLCMIPENKNHYHRNIFTKDYSSEYKHIFILGPLSEESLHAVSDTMNRATSTHPVIIHYQGESHLAELSEEMEVQALPARGADGANDKYKNFYGLTPKGGLFSSSFNWVGGMKHGIQLRNALESCENCYTICVSNTNPDLEYVSEKFQEVISALDEKKGLNSEMRLPLIYKSINDYILNTIYSDERHNLKLLELKGHDVTVIEDLYDKDNSTALEIIARQTANKMRTILVGREIGKILYKGVEATSINRRVSELCTGGCVPPYIKPNDFPSGMFFTLLNFFCGPGCPTWSVDGSYWPAFKSEDLTQELDHSRTIKENILMASALLHLLTPEARLKINLERPINARDESSIALAGNVSGECFPFNELLFVPGLLYALDIINNTNKYSQKSISKINKMRKNILVNPFKYLPGHMECKGRKPADCTAPCMLTINNICRQGTNMTPKRKNRSKMNWAKIRSKHMSQKAGGYLYIVNPITNRKVNIYGKIGQNIIRNYLNTLNNSN